MARCKSCSAPLLANTTLCRYCGVRNDIDLHGRHQYSLHSSQSKRLCPECNEHLQTIDLNLNGPFLIERCEQCFGLFFDPGEVEILLESSVSNVFDINHQLLHNINKDRYRDKQVKYLKCPDCQILMNRVNFGHRSGVVIDRCKKHGVWLESGEITHLMEWKKAGGQILHRQNSEEKPNKRRTVNRTIASRHISDYSYAMDSEPDLIQAVSDLVSRLFN
ncbi:zf-TFIIB domain-containing protein [Methylomarinum sp. Ch1-1]|uniref:Zf-TFIIB domain-containing protein n=1 Tax=Methylomarinum roseum TaxID=3067653 RepID=A0AAU7NUC9_9GAMM|nr:zf-TFIIB domain-containing protein [Methylomarinum sp. Ch1-1]MDP4519338.1 zf-TFIIB domain-containing protein [Methylomarinum sp. Ch1-1]